MTPSLKHLVEDHFKPKWWWQLFRKQKFHVCQNWGNAVIYAIPTKCAISGKLHEARPCAQIVVNEIKPRCSDGCPPIKASDPAFFQKLDDYLARQCYADERELAKDVMSPTMAGTQAGTPI